MKTLTWEELDQCKTADAIADLLRHHGIKGARHSRIQCPLAKATGWQIHSYYALPPGDDGADACRRRALTVAQRDFVSRADDGKYPDLAPRPWWEES